MPGLGNIRQDINWLTSSIGRLQRAVERRQIVIEQLLLKEQNYIVNISWLKATFGLPS